MDIHEYQAKQLLAARGVPIQQGTLLSTASQIIQACTGLTAPFVVKAQVHAGGRGKGGGIRFASTPEKAQEAAQGMLGKPLVTPQTGPEGKKVHDVYVVEAADFEIERYVSFFLNREKGCVSVMVSAEGGGEIEEVSSQKPEAVLTLDLDLLYGLRPFHVKRLITFLALPDSVHTSCAKLLRTLYDFFVEKDLSLLEINPLVVTTDEKLLVIDSKVSFDDNALYRHPDIQALRDTREEAPQETEAIKHGLSYVQLEGNIGCMVNGAGLAMATMDTLQLYGGKPANFLDVGGSASFGQVREALKIILSDANVSVIIVNIFGGIMHCDLIAKALDEAVRLLNITKPLVVRLAGSRAKEAKEFLASSDMNIQSAASLAEAAEKAVALSQKKG